MHCIDVKLILSVLMQSSLENVVVGDVHSLGYVNVPLIFNCF